MTETTVNEMKVDPANTALLIHAVLSKVGPNPFRDMVMFPIDVVDKVPSLVESMEKTGVWPSIIARPKDNMIDGKVVSQEELIAFLNSGADASGIDWEKAFGHHRQAAIQVLGHVEMPIIPQVQTDEVMLLMMANENKEGFGSNINSSLETVRQVHVRLLESIQDFDDFDAYVESNGGIIADCFFKTSKQFLTAQKRVGFRTVRRFLGETWNERDVRAPFAVLRAVDDGFFHQEDIVNVQSMGLLEEIASISRVIWEGYTPQKKDAEAVAAPDWPPFFKTEAISDVIKRCCLNHAEGKNSVNVTVAQLAKARQALQKEGVNPASFLRSGKGKTAFDILAAAKKLVLVEDKPLEHNLKAIAELDERDGFEGWAGLATLKEALVKSAERLAAGETDGVDTSSGLDATSESDVNASIVEGESAVEAGKEPAFSDVGEDGAPMPINQLVQAVMGDAEIMGSRVDMLLNRVGEFEADENFTMSLSGLLNKVAILANLTVGKSALTDAFNAATKPMPTETVSE